MRKNKSNEADRRKGSVNRSHIAMFRTADTVSIISQTRVIGDVSPHRLAFVGAQRGIVRDFYNFSDIPRAAILCFRKAQSTLQSIPIFTSDFEKREIRITLTGVGVGILSQVSIDLSGLGRMVHCHEILAHAVRLVLPPASLVAMAFAPFVCTKSTHEVSVEVTLKGVSVCPNLRNNDRIIK